MEGEKKPGTCIYNVKTVDGQQHKQTDKKTDRQTDRE